MHHISHCCPRRQRHISLTHTLIISAGSYTPAIRQTAIPSRGGGGVVLNSFLPRLQVGRRNQIQRRRFEKHLIKQYSFYLRALVPQHQKMLDLKLNLWTSLAVSAPPSGIQREMEELRQGAAGGITSGVGANDLPHLSSSDQLRVKFDKYLRHI